MRPKIFDWTFAALFVLFVPVCLLIMNERSFMVVGPLFFLVWVRAESTRYPLRAALKIFMLETIVALGVWCSIAFDNLARLR